MNTFDKFIMWAAALLSGIAIILTVGIAVHGNTTQPQLLGEAGTRFPHGIYVGSQSAAVPIINAYLSGNMACTGASNSIPSQKTLTFDCPVTGVLPTDTAIQVTPASTTPTGILIQTVYASSTNPGFLELVLFNASTTAAQLSTGATGTVPYIVNR